DQRIDEFTLAHANATSCRSPIPRDDQVQPHVDLRKTKRDLLAQIEAVQERALERKLRLLRVGGRDCTAGPSHSFSSMIPSERRALRGRESRNRLPGAVK